MRAQGTNGPFVAAIRLELPPIPERPIRAEAEAALKLLTDLLVGFPFETDVDKAVAKASGLGATPIVPGMDIPNMGRFAVLKDPQGAVFAVFAVTAAAKG